MWIGFALFVASIILVVYRQEMGVRHRALDVVCLLSFFGGIILMLVLMPKTDLGEYNRWRDGAVILGIAASISLGIGLTFSALLKKSEKRETDASTGRVK